MQMCDDPYSGTLNLEIMDGAANYRRWLTGFVDELGCVAGTRTLTDFGAGIGTYSREARQLGYRVLCVEIDQGQRQRLVGDGFEVVSSLAELPDTSVRALYTLNVIEHIEDDATALREMARICEPGGNLLVVVPAFPVLFNNNDRLVGHKRRYGRRQLRDLLRSTGWVVDRCRFGDSLGFIAALAYRLVGRRVDGVLTPGQVRLYDRLLFPLSRRLDVLLGHLVGKNLVVYAHRPPTRRDGGGRT